ncbi:hypothetical protein [Alicycliphilus denitrificans]|uniref:hypothetical protein n=1 Tax=Alicycliphilus denitrificans TaxID=179636 RepID=UPI00384D621B
MPSSHQRKQDSELLLKGAVCALIGAIILLAPYVARSQDVRELMAQAHLAGWFALVLGCAFLLRYGLVRWRRRSH